MSDTISTSEPAGTPAIPVAVSDPGPVASTPDTGASNAQTAATSLPASDPGTAAGSTPAISKADQALEALLAEASAPDNSIPSTPQAQTPAPTEAPAPVATPPVDAPKPVAVEKPAAPVEEHEPEPTQQEIHEQKVPLDKLNRALLKRREAITKAEQLTQELTQERKLVDKVLDSFSHAGIDSKVLPEFIDALSRAKTDEGARALILRQLGIQPMQAQPQQPVAAPLVTAPPAPQAFPPGLDMADVQRRLAEFDVEGVQRLIADAQARVVSAAAPAPVIPTVQAQPATQQVPQTTQQPTRQQAQSLDQEFLNVTLHAHANTLKAAFGDDAARIGRAIDVDAGRKLDELKALNVPISPRVMAKVWTESQGRVLAQESQRRVAAPAPPSSLPPNRSPPPAKPLTADQKFAELARTG